MLRTIPGKINSNRSWYLENNINSYKEEDTILYMGLCAVLNFMRTI
jgi:hypothetical protein